MRPIQLKMSAFGSYSGEETVDFTRLEQGIFLISGDTGAGKTTLFDGIMYALYDVTSGGKRDGAMMRSQYAAPSVRTYVEFTFSCRGKTYRIFRNPEYERESLRRGKNGEVKMTKEKPRAELYLEDGSMYPGMKREVNKKIQEIIGLDGEQFTQMVMIAQGEFLKLLHAKSEERKEIFTRIFHTGIYGRMQDELRRREKEAWQRLKDLERAYELQRAAIRWEEMDGEFPVFQEANPEPGELLNALDELLCRGKAKEEALGERLAYLQRLDWSLKEITAQKRECCQLEAEKSRLEEWLQGKKGHLVRMETQFREQEEVRRRQGEAFAAKRAMLVQTAEKCRILGAKQSQYEECIKRQKKLEASVQFWKIRQAVWEIKSQEQNLSALEEKIKALDAEQKKQKKAYLLWQETDRTYREKSAAYELANERFFKAQAGVLAMDLKEGAPCPVCGAIHHPIKAILPKEAPNQETVRRLRKEQGELESQRDDLQKTLMEINQRAVTLATEVGQAGQHALDPEFVCERQWFLKALDKRKELLEAIQKLEKEGEAWKERMGDLAECAGMPLASLAEYQMQIEHGTKNLSKEQELGAALYAEIQLLRKDMEDTDGEKVLEKIREIDRAAMQLEKESSKAMEEKQKFAEEYHRKSGEAHLMEEKKKLALKALEQKQASFEEMTRESVDFWEKRLQDELTRTEKQQKEVFSQNDSNGLCRRQLEEIGRQFQGHKAEYEQIHHLSSLACGSLSGSIKLDFESYVQRQYFKQVIAHANTRLLRMTSGQFMLKCRDLGDMKNQGKVGLDLDVYSMVTQKTRNVQTLSGGESFMAALSMALGLADVIQNAAGGISLETMFIDEGFGSLDDHAREQAIRVLDELAGEHRMIGIISHVTELKEQIEQQIQVEKGVHGSRIRQNNR